MWSRAVGGLVVVLCAFASADAGQEIAADVYLDKLRGMWLGEIIGNYAGRGLVPGTDRKREGYIVYGGGEFDIGWHSVLNRSTWYGDDDTMLEYAYLDLLKARPDANAQDIKQTWADSISHTSLYIANLQAKWLMQPPPDGEDLLPPATGSIHKNMHFYAIDSQIATESLGGLLPGLRQGAAELCGKFAGVTNEGFSVHAAQYYSAMYAAAAMDANVESVVAKGLAVVPASSRTRQVIEDVIDLYEADKTAGRLSDPNAWRDTQRMLYDDYGTYEGSKGRYHNWVESTVNAGLTTMAVLYGQGDFMRTVEIGVLGGYDADCNPATAGGLIGMMKGYAGPGGGGIVAELPLEPNDPYDVSGLGAIGCRTTISQVALDFQAAGEAQILAAGGSIVGTGPDRTYILPDDVVSVPADRPDPASPGGLVGQALAAGRAVAVSASVEWHAPADDRHNLDAIIDGITDVSFNGHVPYSTEDGVTAAPPGGDWYEILFDRTMTFGSVTFHEGDIRWADTNGNPRLITPRGGYFLNLTVEISSAGGPFHEVTGLQFSEPLDANTFYQIIELTFNAEMGDAIRIRGDPGGLLHFTTIVELEATGRMAGQGDADEDDDIDYEDYKRILQNFGLPGRTWGQGDFDFDGDVDYEDYKKVLINFGDSYAPLPAAPGAVPEPATLSLLLLAGAGLLRLGRSRRR